MLDSVTFRVHTILSYAPRLAEVSLSEDGARKKTCQLERFLDTVYACIDSLENQPIVSRWEKDLEATNDCFFRIFAEDLLLEEEYLHSKNESKENWKWRALENLSYKLVHAYQKAHKSPITIQHETHCPHPAPAIESPQEVQEEEEEESAPLVRNRHPDTDVATSHQLRESTTPLREELPESHQVNRVLQEKPEKETSLQEEPLSQQVISTPVIGTTASKCPVEGTEQGFSPQTTKSDYVSRTPQIATASEDKTLGVPFDCTQAPETEPDHTLSFEEAPRKEASQGKDESEQISETIPSPGSGDLTCDEPSSPCSTAHLSPRSEDSDSLAVCTAETGLNRENVSFTPTHPTSFMPTWKSFVRKNIHTKAILFSRIFHNEKTSIDIVAKKFFKEKDRLILIWATKESLSEKSIIWRQSTTRSHHLLQVTQLLEKLSAHEKFELLHQGLFLFHGIRQQKVVDFFAKSFWQSFKDTSKEEQAEFLRHMNGDPIFRPVLSLRSYID